MMSTVKNSLKECQFQLNKNKVNWLDEKILSKQFNEIQKKMICQENENKIMKI